MKDYAEALKFYLSDRCRWIDRIVFIDNSAADLGPLERLVAQHPGGKQVEFLSFYGLDYPPDYTKGYGEFKLLDHGFENVRLLRRWASMTSGGRSRGDTATRTSTGGPHGAPELRPLCGFPLAEAARGRALMSFSRGGYQRLILGRYPEMAGVQVEDWFFQQFAPLIAGRSARAAGIVPELRHVPRIEGIGGFQNVDYMRGKYRMIICAATVQFFKNLLRPGRRGWPTRGPAMSATPALPPPTRPRDQRRRPAVQRAGERRGAAPPARRGRCGRWGSPTRSSWSTTAAATRRPG